MRIKRQRGLVVGIDLKDIDKIEKAISSTYELDIIYKIGQPAVDVFGLGPLAKLFQEYGSQFIWDAKCAEIPFYAKRRLDTAIENGAAGFIAHGVFGKDFIEPLVKHTKEQTADIDIIVVAELSRETYFHLPLPEDATKSAAQCGAAGIVAPANHPYIVESVRGMCDQINSEMYIMSPGASARQGGSVAEALLAGADYLVVSDEISSSEDPKAKAQEYLTAIDKVINDL